ncbi:hypothetical protein FA15DRAFT_507748 [Coprinopsis marcescibilis]|uniref:F-box domain-containing protein n=1 Tax=Coprinopsis marcescibilis TaxID=230819 RepID=A0A5C3L7D6_COPMA|nr:hypothetical protein FA15DRAFT_507748 [Coprinopsis marcescibilis]
MKEDARVLPDTLSRSSKVLRCAQGRGRNQSHSHSLAPPPSTSTTVVTAHYQSSVSMSELPTELMQQIMGNLADDEPTLMSTALASPTFRDICQQMLFKEIKFTFVASCDQVHPGAKLLPILKASPLIASYIQSVSISDGHIIRRNYRPVAASRLANDSDFAEVLNLLSLQGRVKDISLSNLRWSKLSSTTRNAIFVLCRSRSIQTASIESSPFQLTGLFGQSLKHLTISLSQSESCSLLASSPLETATPPSQLQSLHISLCNYRGQSKLTNIVNFLLDPAATIEIHGLRDLYMYRGSTTGEGSDTYDPDAVQRLLSACGSSLETFTFEAQGNPIQQGKPFIPFPRICLLVLTLSPSRIGSLSFN